MRKLLLLTCLMMSACGASSGGAPVAAAPPGVEGARLFKAKGCVNCHTLGQGVKVGPDLQGLFVRRDEAWVRRYIADPVLMVEQDPVARELKEKFKVQMPRMWLAPGELDQLVDYLREGSVPTNP